MNAPLTIMEDSLLVVGGLLASGLILYRDRRPYVAPANERPRETPVSA